MNENSPEKPTPRIVSEVLVGERLLSGCLVTLLVSPFLLAIGFFVATELAKGALTFSSGLTSTVAMLAVIAVPAHFFFRRGTIVLSYFGLMVIGAAITWLLSSSLAENWWSLRHKKIAVILVGIAMTFVGADGFILELRERFGARRPGQKAKP